MTETAPAKPTKAQTAYAAIQNHPITLAVLPLKIAAQDQAEAEARKVVAYVTDELHKVDGDINQAAPYPDHAWRKANNAGSGSTKERQAHSRYSMFHALVTTDQTKPQSYRPGHPSYKIMSAERCDRYISEARKVAGFSFEAYAVKLIGKIGDVKSASLDEKCALWSFSLLNVELKNGTRQVWKTQMIMNRSGLGTWFNQWPTRQLKRDVKRNELEAAIDARAEEEAHCNAITGGR